MEKYLISPSLIYKHPINRKKDVYKRQWFVAITYSLIFGAMFGDVGQGLILFLGGLFLYKKKHMDLAGIISCAGVFSTFFGFMYGSIFGFEEILHAIWLKPMKAMMDVPLVGRLNAVFVIAIGFGMLLILICMVFNIINACLLYTSSDYF